MIRCLNKLARALVAGSVVLHEMAFSAETPESVIEYGYPEQSIFVATASPGGQADSPMTRLAEILMQCVGLASRAAPYPAARLFAKLREGSTQFSILVRAPALQEYCLFSRQPVFSTTLNLYRIGNTPPISQVADIAGKRLIVIRGYSYGGLQKLLTDASTGTVTEVAGTHRAAFDMLAAGRAPYLLDYASAADHILSEQPINGLQSTPIERLDIFLVLNKSLPNAERLMSRLEEIVRTIDVDQLVRTGVASYRRNSEPAR